MKTSPTYTLITRSGWGTTTETGFTRERVDTRINSAIRQARSCGQFVTGSLQAGEVFIYQTLADMETGNFRACYQFTEEP